tara:strand:+ start:146 stop:673 length:528 start_codon:yes stop_codon:yes gene_type:complete
MAIIKPNNNTISAITALPAAISTGKIGQVLQSVKTNTTMHNNTSFTDVTNMSVTITPTATSSKILIIVDAHMSWNNNYSGVIRLVRDSTAIYQGDSSGSRTQGFYGSVSDENRVMFQVGATFLDSPSTTSATTYKIQSLSQDSASYVEINRDRNDVDANYSPRTASSITAMEILD